MLTARGFWFLTIISFTLVLGVLVLPIYTVVPALVSLSLLLWFVYEWISFHCRANAVANKLQVSRRIVQGGREVPMVWSGIAFEVQVEISQASLLRIPLLILQDRIPVVAQKIDGENHAVFALEPNEPVRLTYKLKSPAPGVLRFEGVLAKIADFQGFFYLRRFLRDETEYLILPRLSDDEGKQRADKRVNTLPPPGIHRLRRPGSGGELLDLRDYRAGDPPKMIAWKPSARRDRLITKEYESDVPVRCILFLDTSEVMQLGPPTKTLLCSMSVIASGIAQASAANRDLVGLTVFDEAKAASIKPARTKLHMINMLRQLAEVSALQPEPLRVPVEQLTDRAHPVAQDLYPELMTKQLNSMSLGRLWLPLLDNWWGWLVLFAVLYPWLLGGAVAVGPKWLWQNWVELMVQVADAFSSRKGRVPFYFLILTLLPVLIGGLIWGIYGIRGWFGQRKRNLTKRKQLAALFALRDRTGAAGIERLIHDDTVYTTRVGQFLKEHQIRPPMALYDKFGRYLFHCQDKGKILADAIVRAVGLARDKELYVIIAELAELGSALEPIIKAARVARARDHQVLVIVPWPSSLPEPDVRWNSKEDTNAGNRLLRKRGDPSLDLLAVVDKALTQQYHDSFRKLRRAFGKVGATVLRVNEGDPVQVVLDRLDRMRGMRSRR